MLLPNIPNSSASRGMWLPPSLFFTICTSLESLICWRVLFQESSCFTLLSRLCHISSFADVHGTRPLKNWYHSTSLLCTLTSQAPNLCAPYNFRKRYIESILKLKKNHMFGQTTFSLPVQNDHMSDITTIPTLINSWLTVHQSPMKATLRFPGCPTNSARNA